jgi:hypothetical protein
MLRHTFLALVLAGVSGFAIASCGNNSNNNGDMGPDMSGGGAADMTALKLNCLGIGYCVATCTNSDVQACFTMCAKMAKAGSQTKFANAFNCGQMYCAPDPDAGMMAACVRTTDPAGVGPPLLCDPSQTYATCSMNGPSGCNTCLDNAVGAPLFGDGSTPPTGMCTDPTAPSCKGGTMCTTQFMACISDP